MLIIGTCKRLPTRKAAGVYYLRKPGKAEQRREEWWESGIGEFHVCQSHLNSDFPLAVKKNLQINLFNRFFILGELLQRVGQEWKVGTQHLVKTPEHNWGVGKRTATETAWQQGLPPDRCEERWCQTKRGREEEGERGSVLLVVYVVRWVHIHFSLAHIGPVGAQDCSRRLHLHKEEGYCSYATPSLYLNRLRAEITHLRLHKY